MPEKDVISNSGYVAALLGIVATWGGWIIRKVFIIDKAYVTREELRDNIKDIREDMREDMKGVHNRLDQMMRDQVNSRD